MAELFSDNIITCFNEKIFFPQKIQGWGYLVAVEASSYNIMHLSQNWEVLLKIEAKQFLGQPLARLIGEDCFENIQKNLTKPEGLDFIYFPNLAIQTPTSQEKKSSNFFEVILSYQEKLLIFEWLPKESLSSADLKHSSLELLRKLRDLTHQFSEREELAQEIMKFIKALTGFDRVLLYAFKEDFSGKVIAEAKEEQLESMLHLHYPSEDIPLEVRNLLKTQKVRMIAGLEIPPSPVLSYSEALPLNMKTCRLRYPPDSHWVYLKNIGIQTSVSVATLRDQELWGVLILHHYTPKFLSTEALLLLEIIAEFLSENLVVLELREKLDYQKKIDFLTSTLIQAVYNNPDIESFFENYQATLKAVFASSSLLLVYKNKIYTSEPNLLPADFVHELVAWLSVKRPQSYYYTRSLAKEFAPAAAHLNICCGIAAICLSEDYKDWLIWMKPEKIDTLVWAGNPYVSRVELIQQQIKNNNFTEKNLFESWFEYQTGFCESWGDLIDYYLEKLASIKHIIQKKELEKIYQSIIEGSYDAIGLYDENFNCLFISPKIKEVLGYSAEEFKNISLVNKIFPDDLPLIKPFLNRGAPPIEAAIHWQIRCLNKEGNYAWLDLSVSPLQSSLGRLHYTVIFRNITAQKEIEVHNQILFNELSAQQNAISHLVGLVVFNQNLEVFSANDYFLDVFKVSSREEIDLKPLLLSSSYPIASTLEELWETVLNNYTWNGELYFEKQGKLHWLSVSIYPYPMEEGKDKLFLMLCLDITKRKEYETEFLKAKEQLEELVTYSPAVIYRARLDNAFHISFISANVGALLGYPRENFINQPEFMIQILHPEDFPLVQKNNSRLLQNGHLALEYRIKNYADEWVWIYDSKRIYQPNEQVEPEIYGSWIDITQKKVYEYELQMANQSLAKSEMELRKSADELQNLNHELQEKNLLLENLIHLERSYNEQLQKVLSDLKKAQKQLIRSEKMASLGTLAAGLAHEINNPVNFIQGSVDILNRISPKIISLLDAFASNSHKKKALSQFLPSDLSKEDFSKLLKLFEKSLNNITLGIQRTTEIITSLKFFARKETGYITKVNIHELLDSTLVLLQNKIKNRITVFKDYDSTLPLIDSAVGQLNQVFLNVINNAIEAIEGTGKIDIITRNQGKAIAVQIRDNGKGIPPEVQDHIFDPFFTTKPIGEGTGLGLSISYHIIQSLGGNISFQTKLGEGTTFEIILPIEYKNKSESS
ncbi:MAG: PAS domain S-box protein [Bacteroidia bacterium]|nr:PAS domain S-box protein [Bacteroidia bacterium]MDW8158826.1 PAS domain S-box protein [Bacteroidia bacterium]